MSEILIYQNENGNIKVDVMFEDGYLKLKFVKYLVKQNQLLVNI
jgi:hypothetical protein